MGLDLIPLHQRRRVLPCHIDFRTSLDPRSRDARSCMSLSIDAVHCVYHILRAVRLKGDRVP